LRRLPAAGNGTATASGPQDSTMSGQVHMLRVAAVPTPAATVLTHHQGLDLDHDGLREFVIKAAQPGTSFVNIFEFYECTGDNSFVLVHSLDLSANQDSYYPGDAGDSDGDGLAELVVFGKDYVGMPTANYVIRLYESESPTTYPTQKVWEANDNANGWPVGALISDTDGDGRQEIIVGGKAATTTGSVPRVAAFESNGNDLYGQTLYQELPPAASQSLAVANDLDGDGRNEVLFGGIPFPVETGRIYAIESDREASIKWSGPATSNTRMGNLSTWSSSSMLATLMATASESSWREDGKRQQRLVRH